MIMSEHVDKIAPALLKAQSSMGNASKDSKNPFFKSSYADVNAVREATHPHLNTNEITVLQPIIQKEGKNFVRTLLLHSSGQYIASDVEIIVAKERDPQAAGSAITYARRYGLQSLVSLGAEDDDGNKAMGFKTAGQKEYAAVKETQPDLANPSETVGPTKVTKSSFRKPAVLVDQSDGKIDIGEQKPGSGWDN